MTEDLPFKNVIRLAKVNSLMTKVNQQINQMNCLNNKDLDKGLSKTSDKRLENDYSIYRLNIKVMTRKDDVGKMDKIKNSPLIEILR